MKNFRYKGGKPLENEQVRRVIADGGGQAQRQRPPGHPRLRHRAGDPRHGRGRQRALVESVVDEIVDVLGRAA